MKSLKHSSLITVLICSALFFTGCVASSPKVPITGLYEPMYTPINHYETQQKQTEPAGYTIGIINMQTEIETTPPNGWDFSSPLQQQYLNGFKNSFSVGLEKILTSKGLSVSGPFDSYEEMTYPQRSRCDFLIQPILKLNFQPIVGGLREIPEYGGPNGERYTYAKRSTSMTVTAEMHYLIYDPLTREKLERHKLKTDPITKSTELIAIQLVKTDQKGKVIQKHFKDLYFVNANNEGYYNGEVLLGKITDDLYTIFMGKVDNIISVEEYAHLTKYKKELEKKKRY